MKKFNDEEILGRQNEPDNEKQDLEKKNKKQKRKIIAKNVTIVVLIIIIILLLLRSCGCPGVSDIVSNNFPMFGLDIDEDAGDVTPEDQQAIIDSLNKKLEAGYMTLSINKNPVFMNGAAKGNLNLINKEENNHPQVLEIYTLKDDADGEKVFDECLYRSGLVPVGKAIEEASLNVYLQAGKYNTMAVIYSVDEETGAVLGMVQTPLEITVLN